MNMHTLIETANQLVADDKGLLAIDESNPTCNKRFSALGIAQNEETRRRWRELIITTPDLQQCISGVILFDETFYQKKLDGTPFIKLLTDANILPGIKVDTGAKPLAGHQDESVTEGLDQLRDRLQHYAELGARFAKWRAVLVVDEQLPSSACVDANAHALARYAALCQEAGLVPIVEPEVLMTGTHSLAQCFQVTESVLHGVFNQLYRQGVNLEALILKPNMVLSGQDCVQQATLTEVAEATLRCLLRVVPAAIPGIAFLSGGQSAVLATARLQAMNAGASLPWALAFSFARAIQQPALELWLGQDENRHTAQRALLKRARCNQAARRGNYTSAMEQDV
ncbi:class I fructose-bisphosphate aldolase [Methylomonas sp. AM2-LC]|uniref:class I fructose-bisphosphate aldolase n=1 Tax=Methylomonas sp. AM2-LC TaxID=3153301 RepID=UPI003267F4BF